MAMTAVSTQALTDAWNTRRPEAVAALFAPDGVRCVMAHPGAGSRAGRPSPSTSARS